MEYENKNTQKEKFSSFSQTEIDAAKQLIELSNSIAESESSITQMGKDRHSNSSNSVTLQWKPQQCKSCNDDLYKVEDVLAEIEEDERLRRKIKRFRYIEDLYKVTDPI